LTKSTPLLQITCNNCNAIIGENKESFQPRRYSFGLWACCGSTPNSAFTLNVLDANEATHLTMNKHPSFGDNYSLVNPPNGMFYNGRLRDSALERLTYEIIYDTGRAELYVDHHRVGVVHLSWDDGRAYFCLDGSLVYLDEIDKEWDNYGVDF
tara:strand:- start:13 stop:471 length:459 start_codon:yes stop_codon:yes gene_type:complete